MKPEFRQIVSDDIERCVELGMEAFRPIFKGWRDDYGEPLFNALRPNWEAAQSDYIREACSSDDRETWVAVVEGRTVGFVVLAADDETGLGQIELLAVDPGHQDHGVGTALNEMSADRLRELGMSFAFLGTGSDSGHAPARRSYEKAGFTPTRIHPIHYFKRL